MAPTAVGFKKLDSGPGTMYAGFPSSFGFGIRGRSYSNCLASTVDGSLSVWVALEEEAVEFQRAVIQRFVAVWQVLP